jgi:hypothetical protein
VAERTVRRSTAVLVAVAAAVAAAGIGLAVGSQVAPAGARGAVATTTSSVPESLYVGQGRDWLAQHGEDLTLISTWARYLGDAARANNARLVNLAITEMLTQVRRASADLPTNAFGERLHGIFQSYVDALYQLRGGLAHGDQHEIRAGGAALALAVQQFGAATAGLQQKG